MYRPLLSQQSGAGTSTRCNAFLNAAACTGLSELNMPLTGYAGAASGQVLYDGPACTQPGRVLTAACVQLNTDSYLLSFKSRLNTTRE